MDLLAALKQEEAKFEKQASAAQQQLDTVRAAIKLLSGMGSSAKTTGKRKKTIGALYFDLAAKMVARPTPDAPSSATS